MKVHKTTIGYYGVHYPDIATIEVAETELQPCTNFLKMARQDGLVPMLLSKRAVRQHRLPSAVVWKAA